MSLFGFLQPYLTPAMTAISGYQQGQHQRESDQQTQMMKMLELARQKRQDADSQAMQAARMGELKSQTAKRDLDATMDRRAWESGRREFGDDQDYPEAYSPGDFVNLNKTKRAEGVAKGKEDRANERARYNVEVLYNDLYQQYAPFEADKNNKPDWREVEAIGKQRAGQQWQQEQQGRAFGQQDVNRTSNQKFQQGQQQSAQDFSQAQQGRSQQFSQDQQGRSQQFSQDQQGRAQQFAAAQKAAGGAGGVSTKVGMNRAYASQIKRAIDSARANPQAFSVGRAVASDVFGKWGERVMQRVDKPGNDAASQVADLTSALLHKRSGAAVTVSEFDRMRPFLPQAGDDFEKVIMNLENMLRVVEDETSELDKLSRPYGGDVRPSAPLRPAGGGAPRPGSAAGSIRAKTDDLIQKYRK